MRGTWRGYLGFVVAACRSWTLVLADERRAAVRAGRGTWASPRRGVGAPGWGGDAATTAGRAGWTAVWSPAAGLAATSPRTVGSGGCRRAASGRGCDD